VLVSALCSLYRGGDFIEQFMDNITSQSCFRDYAELVIVDADSPEDEYETIKRYLAKFKNINYLRMNYRIGIYDAWNVAAKAARGEYLTNTNLDDLRRRDSLEIQAGVLDNLPFVDVVYQDLYYSFDPRLPFEQVAAFGHETTLPPITAHNMIRFNSPHNAPMWRKSLHDELGWFDTRYRSAGDHEFWMRCLAAGKRFYKTNDPHVVYYQNPKGLSTRPDTRGVVEAMDIHKTYCRKIIPRETTMGTDEFRALVGREGGAAAFRAPTRDRYAMAQDALRDLARTGKYAGGAA
jgi:glycosyltransferase involved in cell wall biosynthesis